MSIKTFFTSKYHCFQSPIHNLLLHPVKKFPRLNQKKNMHRTSTTIYKQNLSKTDKLLQTCGFLINWWTGVVWITMMSLSAVWPLTLMAPIHRRGSAGSKWCHAESVLIKKRTHLHLGWPEDEYIFKIKSFLAFYCYW